MGAFRFGVFLALILAGAGGAAAKSYRLARFSVEVTCPVGHPLMAGGIAAAAHVVDPLYAKGVVLLGPDTPVAFVSIDWCEIRNEAYDRFREAIAEAAGTSPERVLLSSVHVHDAPVADFRAQRLLDEQGLRMALCDVDFVEDCMARCARAVRRSLDHATPVTHYGVGEAEVKEIASNRRVVNADGTVEFSRGSSTASATLREQPTGVHDPRLSMLSFWNGEEPVAALFAYATHPMSYYGKGGISADFVGLARRRWQAQMPEVAQVYFSGCSGDVTAGKWNDGDPANRPVLADKLHRAIEAAWQTTERYPLEMVQVRVAPLRLEPKATAGFSLEDMRRILADSSAKTFDRVLAAMGLSWRERVAAGEPIDVVAVDFGKAQFLLMPAESFVQYQLDARAMRPDQTIITAGYAECAPGYIPSESAAREGFNDAHSWCWVAPGAHGPMREAIRKALGAR